MSVIKKYIGDLYLTTRFYLALGLCIVLYIVSFFVPEMFVAINILLLVTYAMTVLLVSSEKTVGDCSVRFL